MVMVGLGDCPSSDKGMGCKHGSHGHRYSVSIFCCQLKSSLRRRWNALVVGGDQGHWQDSNHGQLMLSSLHNATLIIHDLHLSFPRLAKRVASSGHVPQLLLLRHNIAATRPWDKLDNFHLNVVLSSSGIMHDH